MVGWQKRPPVTASLRYAKRRTELFEDLPLAMGSHRSCSLTSTSCPWSWPCVSIGWSGSSWGDCATSVSASPFLGGVELIFPPPASRQRGLPSCPRVCWLMRIIVGKKHVTERTDAPVDAAGYRGSMSSPAELGRATCYGKRMGLSLCRAFFWRCSRACESEVCWRSVGPACVGWQLLARSRHKDQGPVAHTL